jgi:hypothetical protein
VPANLRLRLALFFSKKWLPDARRRKTLPVLVTLIRFLVPLWVFNLGIIISYLLLSDDKTEHPASELGWLVRDNILTQQPLYPFCQLITQLFMG